MNKATTKRLLSEVTKQVRELLGPKLKSVILYGSYARGDYDNESDIDIMVLADVGEKEIREYQRGINRISSRVSLENDIHVSVFLNDKTTFEERLPILPYFRNVVTDGVVIYAL